MIGAALLGIGLAVNRPTRSWVWIALPADYGTLILIASLPFLFREFWPTSDWNLLHKFEAVDTGRKIAVKLYQSGRATIEIEFGWPETSGIASQYASMMGLCGNWRDVAAGYSISGFGGLPEFGIERVGKLYISKFNGPANPRIGPLDGMKLSLASRT